MASLSCKSKHNQSNSTLHLAARDTSCPTRKLAVNHRLIPKVISCPPKHHSLTSVSSPDLPPVKPSAIAIGAAYSHAISLAVMGPLFGETYHRAQAANSKEEFFKSRESATAISAWGSSLAGSALQAYGVGALINATGTLSQKGAAYLGTLVFFASAAPSVSLLLLLAMLITCLLYTSPSPRDGLLSRMPSSA